MGENLLMFLVAIFFFLQAAQQAEQERSARKLRRVRKEVEEMRRENARVTMAYDHESQLTYRRESELAEFIGRTSPVRPSVLCMCCAVVAEGGYGVERPCAKSIQYTERLHCVFSALTCCVDCACCVECLSVLLADRRHAC